MLKEKNIFLLQLGQKIRYERIKRKFSQEKLAELSGLNMRSISLLECGLRDVKISTLANISEAFGIELSELFNFNL